MCGHGAWLTRTNGRARGYKQGGQTGKTTAQIARFLARTLYNSIELLQLLVYKGLKFIIFILFRNILLTKRQTIG